MPDKSARNPVPINLDEDPHKNRQRLLWGIVCIIGPGLLFVLTILAYALINFITASNTPAAPTESDLFVEPSPGRTAANIVLYLVGTLSALAFIPGIIIGIILLTKRKKPRQS